MEIQIAQTQWKFNSPNFQKCCSAFSFSPIPGKPFFFLHLQFPISLFNLIIAFRSWFFREVILEKQLTGHRVDRSICNWFWDHAISQPDSFKVVVTNFFNLLYSIIIAIVWLFSSVFTATTCDCFSYTLSFSSFSWRNHFFGLYSSWNATVNGHWGNFMLCTRFVIHSESMILCFYFNHLIFSSFVG